MSSNNTWNDSFLIGILPYRPQTSSTWSPGGTIYWTTIWKIYTKKKWKNCRNMWPQWKDKNLSVVMSTPCWIHCQNIVFYRCWRTRKKPRKLWKLLKINLPRIIFKIRKERIDNNTRIEIQLILIYHTPNSYPKDKPKPVFIVSPAWTPWSTSD